MVSDAMYTPLLAHPDITPHDNDNDHLCKRAADDSGTLIDVLTNDPLC